MFCHQQHSPLLVTTSHTCCEKVISLQSKARIGVNYKVHRETVHVYKLNTIMCGSRKYSYPHHGGNWKFRPEGWGGGGGSKAQEIPEKRGDVSEIMFPDGQVRCCDDPVRKSLLIYFADILHTCRINITSGIWYTIVLHFKAGFLVVVHLKLTRFTKNLQIPWMRP